MTRRGFERGSRVQMGLHAVEARQMHVVKPGARVSLARGGVRGSTFLLFALVLTHGYPFWSITQQRL